MTFKIGDKVIHYGAHSDLFKVVRIDYKKRYPYYIQSISTGRKGYVHPRHLVSYSSYKKIIKSLGCL